MEALGARPRGYATAEPERSARLRTDSPTLVVVLFGRGRGDLNIPRRGFDGTSNSATGFFIYARLPEFIFGSFVAGNCQKYIIKGAALPADPKICSM